MGIFSNIAKSFMIGNTTSMSYSMGTHEEDLVKSERIQESKAIIEDPLSIVQSLGYKDKPFSLTYETLNQMAVRNSVVAAIITTRVNQVSSFSKPARYTKELS